MSALTLLVNEIFCSIQGESTWSGIPCVFVRLRGCPHRCHYCDTSYAFEEGNKKTIQQIQDEVNSYHVDTIEITGGEPLLQKNVHPLMSSLCDEGKNVLLETCGSRDISGCDPRVIRIIDIKTPNSGAANTFLLSNLDHLKQTDEIKFVITSFEDFTWALNITKEHDLFHKVHAVHLSPVMEQNQNEFVKGCHELNPQLLADWLIESKMPFRLQVQLHKIVWSPQLRGV